MRDTLRDESLFERRPVVVGLDGLLGVAVEVGAVASAPDPVVFLRERQPRGVGLGGERFDHVGACHGSSLASWLGCRQGGCGSARVAVVTHSPEIIRGEKVTEREPDWRALTHELGKP